MQPQRASSQPTEKPRPTMALVRRNRLLVSASVPTLALVALGLQTWAGQPQKLFEWPQIDAVPAALVGVQDGTLYTREQRVNGQLFELTIRARAAEGGPWRTVVHDAHLPAPVEEVAVQPNGIFYRFGNKPDTHSTAVWRERPVIGMKVLFPVRRMRMRRAPLTGGPSQEVAPAARASEMWISGEYCYWIRSELTERAKPLSLPVNAYPRAELLATPLAGGSTRRIARLGDYRSVTPCPDGLQWITTTDQVRAAVRTHPPDFRLVVIAPYSSYQPPVVCTDCLYWLQSGNKEEETKLIRARRDGSGREEILNLPPQSHGSLLSLGARKGGLFCVTIAQSAATRGQSQMNVYSLDGLRPRPAAWLGTLLTQARVPTGRLTADGDYLYFVRSEERENWLDWSASGLTQRQFTALYRIRLPD